MCLHATEQEPEDRDDDISIKVWRLSYRSHHGNVWAIAKDAQLEPAAEIH